MTENYTVQSHFINKDPNVKTLYNKLLATIKRFGKITEDPKKTSIHINRNSAMVGVETRKDCLLLNIKSDHAIKSKRIEKSEQISAKRFHHKIRIKSLDDFDNELEGWLQDAYLLSE